jgi:hypothetical protein
MYKDLFILLPNYLKILPYTIYRKSCRIARSHKLVIDILPSDHSHLTINRKLTTTMKRPGRSPWKTARNLCCQNLKFCIPGSDFGHIIGNQKKGTKKIKGTNGDEPGGAEELVELGGRRVVALALLGVVVAEAPQPPQWRLHLW